MNIAKWKPELNSSKFKLAGKLLDDLKPKVRSLGGNKYMVKSGEFKLTNKFIAWEAGTTGDGYTLRNEVLTKEFLQSIGSNQKLGWLVDSTHKAYVPKDKPGAHEYKESKNSKKLKILDPSGEGWIIGDPVDFLTNVEEIFEQINKEPMGQKLFDRVRDKGKKLKINYKPEDLEFSYKKESLFVGTISDIEKMKGSGKGMAPIVMAHELIHYVHWSESEEAYKKRRGEIVAEWSNEEEYLTIHGHTSKSKTKDDVYENGIREEQKIDLRLKY